MIIYYNLSLILGGVAMLISGLIVYLNNPKKSENIAWFLLSICTSIWSFGYYVLISVDNYYIAFLSNKILHTAAIFIPPFYFLFTLFLTNNFKKYKFIFIIFVFTGFLFLTSNINSTLTFGITPKYIFKYAPVAGKYYPYFTAYFFLLMFYSLFLLNKATKLKENYLDRQKFKLVFLFSIIGFIGGSSVFFLTFNKNIPPYPLVLFSIYPIIMAYAIIKRRLFNVKIIATELLTFTIWIFVLIKIIIADSIKERITSGGLLFFLVVSGILLGRSVLKEVRAREEIEELATKLEFANLRLKQLDEAKSDFLSIASHQLRTPLTAIKGYASMILEGSYGKISEMTKSAMDKIFQSSQRLVVIIGDFLDISHIEQGTMQYDFAPVDLKELVRGLADEFKATIENSADKSKTLKISFRADEKENFKITADYNKIRQVVSNLIDNSIKYTPEGFVKVSLSKIPENGNVLLKIEDSGIGISTETMPNLFKKFGRAKSLSNMYSSGSGLGLYVAKEIIKAHKGKIWAESEGEGKGSRFYVELPMR